MQVESEREKDSVAPIDRLVAEGVVERVEIARSFSYRMNIGNWQHIDYFCSEKAECNAAHAEAVSDALYDFCKNQVLKSVKLYREHIRQQKLAMAANGNPVQANGSIAQQLRDSFQGK